MCFTHPKIEMQSGHSAVPVCELTIHIGLSFRSDKDETFVRSMGIIEPEAVTSTGLIRVEAYSRGLGSNFDPTSQRDSLSSPLASPYVSSQRFRRVARGGVFFTYLIRWFCSLNRVFKRSFPMPLLHALGAYAHRPDGMISRRW
jgi:hypothetical protein